MAHLYIAIHYPNKEHVDDLIGAMASFGGALAHVSGLLDVSVWRDDEQIVAMSVWESRAALDDAMPTIVSTLADVPFNEWERRERQLFSLDELTITTE